VSDDPCRAVNDPSNPFLRCRGETGTQAKSKSVPFILDTSCFASYPWGTLTKTSHPGTHAVAGSFNNLRMSRMRRKRGPAFVALVCIAVCFALVLLTKSLLRRTRRGDWDTPSGDPSTLVYKREDLQKIWKWEIESGHYPSLQPRMYLLLPRFTAVNISITSSVSLVPAKLSFTKK
jgi:hypothetical protein